jgi:hypothetical protein
MFGDENLACRHLSPSVLLFLSSLRRRDSASAFYPLRCPFLGIGESVGIQNPHRKSLWINLIHSKIPKWGHFEIHPHFPIRSLLNPEIISSPASSPIDPPRFLAKSMG